MEKYLLSLLLLFLSLQAVCQQQDRAQVRFEQATAHLLQGRPADAIAALEALEQEGLKAPEVYSNLGVAYFQAEVVGKAVLFTEKAHALSPLDKALLQNSNFLSKKTGIKTATESTKLATSFSWVKVADKVLQLGLVLFCFSAFLFFLQHLLPRYQQLLQRVYKQSLFFSICLLLVAFAFYQQPNENAVVLQYAVGRNGPSPRSKSVLDLAEGEKLTAVKHYEGWLKVRTSQGREAWVADSLVVRYR